MYNFLADENTGSSLGTIIIMCVLVVAIIGLFVWQSISNKKKQKQAEETVSRIKIGDKVKTIGGVCGFVAELNDKENTFVLRTGMDGKECYVKFDKAAIYQTAPADVVKVEPKKDNVKKEETKKENKKSVKEEKKVDDLELEKPIDNIDK